MSFKAAIRAYLFSDTTVANAVSESGTLAALKTVGSTTNTITVSGLSNTPASRGQLLLKNAAGNYELVNYTAAAPNALTPTDYDFTVSVDLVNAYIVGDYVAVCVGVYSFPAPQSATLPYILIADISTDEVLNKLDGQATVLFESWQLSCFAETDGECDTIKDAVVDAMNLVNPTTWSDDGFATAYTVDTAVFISHTTIEDTDNDGTQTPTIHKPLTFMIKRSIAAT